MPQKRTGKSHCTSNEVRQIETTVRYHWTFIIFVYNIIKLKVCLFKRVQGSGNDGIMWRAPG